MTDQLARLRAAVERKQVAAFRMWNYPQSTLGQWENARGAWEAYTVVLALIDAEAGDPSPEACGGLSGTHYDQAPSDARERLATALLNSVPGSGGRWWDLEADAILAAIDERIEPYKVAQRDPGLAALTERVRECERLVESNRNIRLGIMKRVDDQGDQVDALEARVAALTERVDRLGTFTNTAYVDARNALERVAALEKQVDGLWVARGMALSGYAAPTGDAAPDDHRFVLDCHPEPQDKGNGSGESRPRHTAPPDGPASVEPSPAPITHATGEDHPSA